jgi:hypothetical protein
MCDSFLGCRLSSTPDLRKKVKRKLETRRAKENFKKGNMKERNTNEK